MEAASARRHKGGRLLPLRYNVATRPLDQNDLELIPVMAFCHICPFACMRPPVPNDAYRQASTNQQPCRAYVCAPQDICFGFCAQRSAGLPIICLLRAGRSTLARRLRIHTCACTPDHLPHAARARAHRRHRACGGAATDFLPTCELPAAAYASLQQHIGQGGARMSPSCASAGWTAARAKRACVVRARAASLG